MRCLWTSLPDRLLASEVWEKLSPLTVTRIWYLRVESKDVQRIVGSTVLGEKVTEELSRGITEAQDQTEEAVYSLQL